MFRFGNLQICIRKHYIRFKSGITFYSTRIFTSCWQCFSCE